MFQNYLKVAWRNLIKYKVFSAINIFGLALSMSVCLILILLIKEQTSYDRFQQNKDRLYRVVSDVKASNGRVWNFATSPAPLGPVLLADYPGIQEVVRLRRLTATAIYQEQGLEIKTLFAEPAFFRAFSFKLAGGDPLTALVEPHAIILSEELANKFFGGENPVGKTMRLDGVGDVAITGVLKKPSGKSHMKFDALLSFSTLTALNDPNLFLTHWQNSITRYYNYLVLDKAASAAVLQAQFPEIIKKYYPDADPDTYAFHLQAVTDINLGPHLSNNLGPTTPGLIVYFLAGLTVVVILTACFNYTNLTVARSLKRAKEVGVRKVVGARRAQTIGQVLVESILVALAATIFAFVFLEWLVPAFNNLSLVKTPEWDLSLEFAKGFEVYAIFVVFSMLVGLLAGIYPAIYFSSFVPAIVLKGLSKIKGFSGLTLRKALIVVQFAMSLLFIVSTILIYRQSEFVLAADYGFNKEHVINIRLQDAPYESLRNELLKHAGIVNVSATSVIPVTDESDVQSFKIEKMDKPMSIECRAIDENFVENLGLAIVAGRNFSKNFSTDPGGAVILNEKAVRELGLGAPLQAVGQPILMRPNTPLRVVGVVKDFHFASLQEPILPLAFIYNSEQFTFANVRIRPGNIDHTLAFIATTWKKFDRFHPLDYQFFDVQVEHTYAIFKDLIRLIGLTAGLVICIACLGLLGMAIYNAETRVGVMDFGFGILATLLLAILTISSQAFKAARANPVEALRYE